MCTTPGSVEIRRTPQAGHHRSCLSQFTAAGAGKRLMLIVHHDDAEREFAYDRQSHIGKLDKAWDEAMAKGRTVVSVKERLEEDFCFRTVEETRP